MSDTTATDNTALARGVADALTLFVGPGKRYSRDLIAEATQLDPRTVKAHCLGQTPPSIAALFAYFRVLPVEFADHVLGLAGLGGVRKVDADSDAFRTMKEMADGVAALATALADGRIDHRERSGVARELREAAVAAEQLAADLDREAGR